MKRKIQIKGIASQRRIVDNLDSLGQVSAKVLIVIVKGIEVYVDPKEMKENLVEQRFKIKKVSNIYNREKMSQPKFKVE